MPSRTYTQRERRLLSEFLALTRPNKRIILNPRLGAAPLHFGATVGINPLAQTYKQAMLYADAVVIDGQQAELWEAKIILDGRAIGQLLEYQMAVPQSPDFVEFRHMEITLHIVASAARQTAIDVAARLGIRTHLYTPGWVVEQWADWYGHQSQPIHPASAIVRA